LNETRELTAEQIMAMHLTYLKSIAEMNLHTKVIDCVMTVPPTEKPHIVVFVDLGYASLQCSAVSYHKGKLKMMATTFDNNLGL